MNTDLDTLLIVFYVLVDDHVIPPAPPRPSKLSDAELVCLAGQDIERFAADITEVLLARPDRKVEKKRRFGNLVGMPRGGWWIGPRRVSGRRSSGQVWVILGSRGWSGWASWNTSKIRMGGGCSCLLLIWWSARLGIGIHRFL